MISSPSNLPVEDDVTRPSRSTSCQLPVQCLGRGHRPTQSCDESSKQHTVPPTAQRNQSYKDDYQGAKYEKSKPSQFLASPAWLLSTLMVLVPLVFLGGYSTAVYAGPLRGSRIPLGLGRITRGGADGRLLSHRDDAQQQSVDILQEDVAASEEKAIPAHAAASPMLAGERMLFVTWIAFGDFGDGGFKTHNFHKVDMRWADVARRSHPGCKIGLVLDQDTQLDHPEGVDFLHRLDIDKKVYGRNEYNDFYHWTARYSMLEKLQHLKEETYNVIFLDPDVFVLDDVQEVFDHGGFDYMTTISENPYQPINGAMHFVRAHRYGGAIDLLKGVLASFQLKPEMGFTAGQQAYSDYFELTGKEALVKQLQEEAVSQGVACNKIQDGNFNICFVICTRYNFWEDCTAHPAMRVTADRADEYASTHVKVMHFIAYRKLGMQLVYNAFLADGLEGAYKAWAELPHTEDGYKADPRFGEEA